MPLWSSRPILQATFHKSLAPFYVQFRITLMQRDGIRDQQAKDTFFSSSDYVEVGSFSSEGTLATSGGGAWIAKHSNNNGCGRQLEHVCCHHESLPRATSDTLLLNLTQSCHCVLSRSGVLVESLNKPVFLKKCLGPKTFPAASTRLRFRTY